jgi:CHASE3 domain sensor protein
MTNKMRLKLIGYFFYATIVLTVLILAIGGFVASTLVQYQKWVSHTNKVLEQTDSTKESYSAAHYAARLKIVTGHEKDLSEQRDRVFQNLALLKQLTADNNEQLSNLTVLEASTKHLFAIQDTQAASVMKQGSTLVYDAEQVNSSIQLHHTIETTFYVIKQHEYNQLNLVRMPQLIEWQWRLTAAAFFLVAMLIVVLIIKFMNTKKMLSKMIYLSERIDDLVEKTDSDVQLRDELPKFQDYLEGKRNELYA